MCLLPLSQRGGSPPSRTQAHPGLRGLGESYHKRYGRPSRNTVTSERTLQNHPPASSGDNRLRTRTRNPIASSQLQLLPWCLSLSLPTCLLLAFNTYEHAQLNCDRVPKNRNSMYIYIYIHINIYLYLYVYMFVCFIIYTGSRTSNYLHKNGRNQMCSTSALVLTAISSLPVGPAFRAGSMRREG